MSPLTDIQGSDTNKRNSGNDSIMLSRLRDGDPAAFEWIYTRWHKPVFLLMLKITRSEQDAEDICQDVFSYLWTTRERLDPAGNIKALIFTIARRAAIRLSKRNSFHDGYLAGIDNSPELDNDPSELFIAEEIKLIVDYAIEKMPEKQREVFKLHYYENLSYAQIAEKLGMQQNNVRQHYNNAKHFLDGVLALIVGFFLS